MQTKLCFSVIVTNWNYGGFLADALNSVLQQTMHPAEIIVVDDGSTDISSKILAEFENRITLIRLKGSGQAAAFNAGYKASSGDLILFLDADDMLRPEAFEVVAAHWSPQLAVLSFLLETTDAAGRSTGIHPQTRKVMNGDNRPLLLRRGSLTSPFHFAPTSGNIFSRSFLDWAMPMPERDWRLCADAWLVRAAALFGPFRRVDRRLGIYRMHGGNGYIRPDSFDDWTLQRGLRDVQTAVAALTQLTDLAESGELDLAMRLRSMETLGHIAAWTGQTGDYWPAWRRSMAAAVKHRAVWAVNDLQQMANKIRRSGPFEDPSVKLDRLLAKDPPLCESETPRWIAQLPLRDRTTFGSPGDSNAYLGAGWSADTSDMAQWSAGKVARLHFSIPPAEGPLRVELCFVQPQSEQCPMSIHAEGVCLWKGDLSQDPAAAFALDRDLYAALQSVCLELRATGRFALTWIEVHARETITAFPMAETGMRVLEPDLGWSPRPDGSMIATRDDPTLAVTQAPSTSGEIEVILSHDTCDGWLVVNCEGYAIWTGHVTGGARMRWPVASHSSGESVLSLGYRPSEVQNGTLAIRHASYRPRSTDPENFSAQHYLGSFAASLDPGQQIVFADNTLAERFLGTGWDLQDRGALNIDAEAQLIFHPPDALQFAQLQLDFEPTLPSVDGRRLLVGVSDGENILVSADLQGQGVLTVDLPHYSRALAGASRVMVLTVHAAFADETGSKVSQAPVLLNAMTLVAEPLTPARGYPETGYPVPQHLSWIEDARRALKDEDIDWQIGLLSRFASMFADLDHRALASFCLEEGALETLERLGRATSELPLPEHQSRFINHLEHVEDAGEKLRNLLLAMALVPAFEVPWITDFTHLPALVLQEANAVVSYLCREPVLTRPGDAAAHISYLCSLLKHVDEALAAAPAALPGRLAASIIQRLRSTTLLFSSENLREVLTRRGAVMERLLIQTGADLSGLPVRRASNRLRLGVFVRHLRPSPEAYAVMGMCRHLDLSIFEPILITREVSYEDLPIPESFEGHFCLGNESVLDSVQRLRALKLDVFLLCSYVANWETVTSIVAHRLASLQISSCFNNPTTLGFQSFDVALAWQGIDIEEQQAHYLERLEVIDAPLQCCFDFSPQSPAEPFDRIDDGSVLMVSTALAQKIQPQLMDAWARILSQCPDARLILMPYAKVWSMDHTPEIFEIRLASTLERYSVDQTRLTLLSFQSEASVRGLLEAADIYLDSFPYSGSTTVAEAMRAFCPVVALHGSTLRGQSGALWLREAGMPELIANEPDDYVRIAKCLIEQPELREAARKKLQDLVEFGVFPFSDSERFGKALSQKIHSLANARNLLPDPKAVPSTPIYTPPLKKLSRKNTITKTVVLAQPRTGSTLLCSILERCEDAMVDQELFHEDHIQYAAGTCRTETAIASRNADPVGWLERHHAHARQMGYRFICFKLFSFHNSDVLKHVTSNPDFSLIVLDRENRLAQFSSAMIAQATGQWILHKGEVPRRIKLDFQKEQFENWTTKMDRFARQTDQYIARNNRQVHRIDYTDLLNPEAMKKLSIYLGYYIPTMEAMPTERQNAACLLDRFQSPDSVRNYIEETGKSHWLKS